MSGYCYHIIYWCLKNTVWVAIQSWNDVLFQDKGLSNSDMYNCDCAMRVEAKKLFENHNNKHQQYQFHLAELWYQQRQIYCDLLMSLSWIICLDDYYTLWLISTRKTCKIYNKEIYSMSGLIFHIFYWLYSMLVWVGISLVKSVMSCYVWLWYQVLALFCEKRVLFCFWCDDCNVERESDYYQSSIWANWCIADATDAVRMLYDKCFLCCF